MTEKKVWLRIDIPTLIFYSFLIVYAYINSVGVCILKSDMYSYYLTGKTLKQVSENSEETITISNEVAEVINCKEFGPIIYKNTDGELQIFSRKLKQSFSIGRSTIDFIEGNLVFFTDHEGKARVFSSIQDECFDLPEGKIVAHTTPFNLTLIAIEQSDNLIDLYGLFPYWERRMEKLADDAKLVTPLNSSTEVFGWLNGSTLSVIVDYMENPKVVSESCKDVKLTTDGEVLVFKDDTGTHWIDFFTFSNEFEY